MDDVISKLAEIELAASKIMENVAEEKKSLSLENEARMKAFDDEVDKKTEEKLEGIRKGLEVDMEQELLLQKQQTEATLKKNGSRIRTACRGNGAGVVRQNIKDVILWELCYLTVVFRQKSEPCRAG